MQSGSSYSGEDIWVREAHPRRQIGSWDLGVWLQRNPASNQGTCAGVRHLAGMGNPLDTPGNPDLLRSLIDAGKTFDKVRFPDPSAAPLGTDDEAGGFPPSAAQVNEAIRIETRPIAYAATPSAVGKSVWERIVLLLIFALPAAAVALLALLAVR
jgi:hypothetical protein